MTPERESVLSIWTPCTSTHLRTAETDTHTHTQRHGQRYEIPDVPGPDHEDPDNRTCPLVLLPDKLAEFTVWTRTQMWDPTRESVSPNVTGGPHGK